MEDMTESIIENIQSALPKIYQVLHVENKSRSFGAIIGEVRELPQIIFKKIKEDME